MKLVLNIEYQTGRQSVLKKPHCIAFFIIKKAIDGRKLP